MTRTSENIGLLFVHGIGEQKKLEHLSACAREFAALVGKSEGLIRLDVRDESATEGRIVIEAVYLRGTDEALVRLHLHEVWWADLGASGGLGEQVRFWLWSLGQWAAQVVREGNPGRNTFRLMDVPSFDPSTAAAAPPKTPKETEEATLKAKKVPGWFSRIPSRVLLFMAGMLAFLTLFSWSAAKRVISFLAQRLPEPSLIFLFLGDVKTYEEGGRPGKGLLDPNQPMRTTIRRRMVSAMTAMAKRPDYGRWYIFAHSLGTVPAFNILQETEWTLPNYLSEAEWAALPARFKTETPFAPPDPADHPKLDNMMPRRPPWLKGNAGIDRRALFARFAGFVTYGSPLDKFAALWPRVVPLNRQVDVFPEDCEWVNLYDPADPVGADLGAFAGPPRRADEPVPGLTGLVPQNVRARAWWVFGVSHIHYFTPPGEGISLAKLLGYLRLGKVATWWRKWRGAPAKAMPVAIVEAIVSGRPTRLGDAARGAALSTPGFVLRVALAGLQLLLLAVGLALAAAVLLYLIGKALPAAAVSVLKQAIGGLYSPLLGWLQGDAPTAILASGGVMMALAFFAVLLSGIVRMIVDLLRPPHG